MLPRNPRFSHGVVVNLSSRAASSVCDWRQLATRFATGAAGILTVLALAMHPHALAAADETQEKSPPIDKPAAPPAPVPVAELSTQAEAVMANLRAMAADAQADDE